MSVGAARDKYFLRYSILSDDIDITTWSWPRTIELTVSNTGECTRYTIHGVKKYERVENWLWSKIFLTQENMCLSQENFLNFFWVRKIFDLSQEIGYFLIKGITITSTLSYFFAPCKSMQSVSLKNEVVSVLYIYILKKCVKDTDTIIIAWTVEILTEIEIGIENLLEFMKANLQLLKKKS